jgi:hypothetical protein
MLTYLFIIVSIFFTLTVASAPDCALDADCTPIGTYLGDTLQDVCPNIEVLTNISGLGKQSHFNINWPDGHADGLTASGTGKCGIVQPCGMFAQRGYGMCWPAFHQPIARSDGNFSIFVENKVAERENHPCPDNIAPDQRIYCAVSGQTTFQENHNCMWGGGGCQEQGQPCSDTSDCCSGACGEVSATCIPCEVDNNHPQGGCMSEACGACYANEGIYCDPWSGSCYTPLIVDVNGDGFELTNLNNGVRYDAFGTGRTIQSSWVKANSDEAWLVLDRNGNGTIDNGTEMFSSVTPQPQMPLPELRHGFNALVQYDKSENGGNADGVLNKDDQIFNSLRLWQDTNRNGIGEPDELHTLPDLGLTSIDMDYKEAKKQDGQGNRFKFRAKVKDKKGAQLGRWIYDVYLLGRP